MAPKIPPRVQEALGGASGLVYLDIFLQVPRLRRYLGPLATPPAVTGAIRWGGPLGAASTLDAYNRKWGISPTAQRVADGLSLGLYDAPASAWEHSPKTSWERKRREGFYPDWLQNNSSLTAEQNQAIADSQGVPMDPGLRRGTTALWANVPIDPGLRRSSPAKTRKSSLSGGTASGRARTIASSRTPSSQTGGKGGAIAKRKRWAGYKKRYSWCPIHKKVDLCRSR